MDWQLTPYSIPLFMAALVSAMLAGYAWQRRAVRSARWMALLLSVIAVWILASAIGLSSTDFDTKVFWYRVRGICLVVTPLTWLLFVISYTRHDHWFTPRTILPVCLVPLVSIFLLVFDPVPGLLVKSIGVAAADGLTYIDYDPGPWFWILVLYSYLALFVGSALLLFSLIQSPKLYRHQAVTMILGSIGPVLAGLAYLLNIGPIPNLSLMPFALILVSVAFAWGVLRYRLLDVLPLARSTVFDKMSDGVIVLDTQERIVDLNTAARQMLGWTTAGVIGKTIAEVAQPGQESLVKHGGDTHEGGTEITLATDGSRRHYELHVSPLSVEEKHLPGRLIALRDVTTRKQAELDLSASEMRFRTVINEMQTGILVCGPRSNVVICNRAALELFDATEQTILGRTNEDPSIDIIHEDGTPYTPETLPVPRVIATAAPVHNLVMGIYRPRKRDRIWVQVNADPQFAPDQTIMQIICTFTDITEQKLAETRQAEQNRLLEDLITVARATAETTDLDTTLQNALNISIALTGAERGSLFLMDKSEQVISNYIVHNGQMIQQHRSAISHLMHHGLAGWVVRHRRLVLIADTMKDDRWLVLPESTFTTRSVFAMPIMSGSDLLGILILMHALPDHFSVAHAQLMQAAAGQMALAMRNAQFVDLQRQTAIRQRTLYEVLRQAGSRLELDAIAQVAVATIAHHTALKNVLIALPFDDDTQLEVRAAHGTSQDAVGTTCSTQSGIIGRAFSRSESQYVPDVGTDPDYWEWNPAIQSELAVPIKRGDRVLGVLNIESEQLDAFQHDDRILAESLAEVVALALENARLYTSVQRELAERTRAEDELRKESRLLQGVTAATNSLLTGIDQDVAINNALELLGLAAGVDRVYIIEHHPHSVRGELALSQRYEWLRDPTRIRSRKPAAQNIDIAGTSVAEWYRMLMAGRTIKGSIKQFPESLHQILASQQICSMLAMPVMVGDTFWGLIGFDDCSTERVWSPSEESILAAAAATIGGAIQRRQVEDAVRDSEAKLSAIIKNSSDSIYIKDRDGRYILINPAGARVVGKSVDEVLGRRDTDIIPSKEAHTTEVIDRKVMEMREPVAYEITFELSGRNRTFYTTKFPYLSHAEEVLGIIGVSRDVTEIRRAEKGLTQQNAYLAMLHETSLALMNRLDLSELLDLIVSHAARLIDGTQSYIYLYNSDTDDLEVKAGTGRFVPFIGEHIQRGEGVAGTVWATGKPFAVAHYDTWYNRKKKFPKDVFQAVAGVPLTSGSQIIGVLGLTYIDEEKVFDNDEIEVLMRFAQVASLSLDNARLYSTVQHHMAELTMLQRIVATINSKLQLDDIFKTVVSQIHASFGYELVSIYLHRDELLQLQAYAGYEEVLWNIPLDRGVMSKVIHSGDALFIQDATKESDFLYAVPGITQAIYIPLKSRTGAVLGTLALESRGKPHLGDNDLAILSLLAEQISVAMENADLFQTVAGERSRLQALIEASRDGVILVDMNYRIRVMNEPALRLLDLPGNPDDWLGRKVSLALRIIRRKSPETANAILAEMRRLYQGDEPAGEGEFVIPPYTLHWVNLLVRAGTSLIGRLMVIHDVTEERALALLREDLTRTMVHDLRNPLQALSTSISLLRVGLPEDAMPDLPLILDVAERSTTSMVGMVTDILDVSRLETGKMPISYEEFSIRELISEVLDMERPLAAQKETTIESDVPRGLPKAWGDYGLIQRVLQNLIGNAIKFTPPNGTIRITAETIQREHPQNERSPLQLLVKVSDTGPGIAPDIQSQLFQKYVTGRHRGRGSGLGLSFCRLAVEAHNEQIWVESELGHGTTFFFTIATV